MRFYHDGNDIWLFGGIFKVLERHPDRNYKVELTGELEEFIGRLKLYLKKEAPTAAPYLETYYDKFEVLEVLQKPYSGQPFPGYESIDLTFTTLETLVRNNRTGWKSALENVSGVYLITDESTGKRYVGSAYGEQGIWSRWAQYVNSGHGWDAKLRELAKSDLKYARKNFRFTLLEYRAASTPKKIILDQETHWKNVLLTKNKYGLNSN